MKFLILGAGAWQAQLQHISFGDRTQCHGFVLTPLPFVKNIVGDASDTETLRKIVREGGYDVVINAIGLLNKTAEEHRAEAVLLNAYLPHFLAEITKDLDTFVIQMSTDCVFSGKTGYYTETSFRDGESFYARTKALGDLEDEKNLTLRYSAVGPDFNPDGIGLFNWFMKQEGTARGYTHAMWTGMTTLQLARVMEKAAAFMQRGFTTWCPIMRSANMTCSGCSTGISATAD